MHKDIQTTNYKYKIYKILKTEHCLLLLICKTNLCFIFTSLLASKNMNLYKHPQSINSLYFPQ